MWTRVDPAERRVCGCPHRHHAQGERLGAAWFRKLQAKSVAALPPGLDLHGGSLAPSLRVSHLRGDDGPRHRSVRSWAFFGEIFAVIIKFEGQRRCADHPDNVGLREVRFWLHARLLPAHRPSTGRVLRERTQRRAAPFGVSRPNADEMQGLEALAPPDPRYCLAATGRAVFTDASAS